MEVAKPRVIVAGPQRAIPGVAGPIVLREHAANDILVNRDAEHMRDLPGDAHAAETWIDW